MINTGLVIEKGYIGLWFTKDILLTIGIAHILFMPMWARLRLTTDNELIRLRFSGTGTKAFQMFRAIYVGLFISSFIISFYTLGITIIREIFFWNRGKALKSPFIFPKGQFWTTYFRVGTVQ